MFLFFYFISPLINTIRSRAIQFIYMSMAERGSQTVRNRLEHITTIDFSVSFSFSSRKCRYWNVMFGCQMFQTCKFWFEYILEQYFGRVGIYFGWKGRKGRKGRVVFATWMILITDIMMGYYFLLGAKDGVRLLGRRFVGGWSWLRWEKGSVLDARFHFWWRDGERDIQDEKFIILTIAVCLMTPIMSCAKAKVESDFSCSTLP